MAPYNATARLTPPRPVTIAFWLFMVVTLVHIVGLVIEIATFNQTVATAKSQVAHTAGSSKIDVNSFVGGFAVAGIVIAVLYVLAFVLFAVFMRRGANWARIVLLIVTVLSVTGVTAGYGLGAVGVVAGIVGIVLTYLPVSSRYFHAVRDAKQVDTAFA